MADSRDTDDYGWLYGSGSRPRPGEGSSGDRAAADDEPTQVWDTEKLRGPQAGSTYDRFGGPPPVRIAPTPGQGPSRSGPPGRGPAGPPPGGGGRPGGRSRGRRRFRPRLRWIWVLLLLWVVYLVAVPVYAWSTVSKVDATPAGKRPADQPGTTYLLVGSDARAGLAGQRTDTIMLLHTGSGPNLLVSIPRDSLVEVPGLGVTKINAAFSRGGAPLLVRTIEGATGIRVDHYVEIGFTGLVRIVDAVGGITICPTSAIKDPLAHLDIRSGCQRADGKTALGYARARHSQTLGDIDRARHQREVVSAIAAEVVSPWTVVNPVRYWRVVTGGAASVQVDQDTGPVRAAEFATAMTAVNGKDGLTCGVPIADLAVHWDTARADAMFKLIAQDRTADIGRLCTPSGQPAG